MKSLLRLALLCSASCAVSDPVQWPGPKGDGSILLPNGWSVAPHGAQVALRSDLPVRTAWHPRGRWLAIQHAGYLEHEVAILDGASDAVVAHLPLPRTWSGMAWSADGARLFVSGGVDDVVHVFDFDARTGQGELRESWPVGAREVLDLPAGMCVDGAGRLCVVLQRSQRLLRLDARGAVELDVPLPAESFPFDCLAPEGRLIVSLWGQGEVWVLDAASGARLHAIPTGEHPSELLLAPDGQRLFVSNANENTVSVIALATGSVQETLCSALYPDAPPGTTPNSLALSPDGKLLVVANADNNDCALIDVAEPGRSRGLGFVPVGLYPTSVRFAPDAPRLYVANGKGSVGSRPNPGGPQPVPDRPHNVSEYVGALHTGSLSIFSVPDERELATLTALAYRCSPLEASAAVRSDARRPDDAPIPARPGEPSPIRYCVYVIKENRTYDQVLGDDPRGNGDPDLCLFPEVVTPNHHALAREFVLLDNFYVESEVSADGHEWTMGAYASDFVERTWPVTYGDKGEVEVDGRTLGLGYPSEGNYEIAEPKSGYLWDRARAAGVSYRSYGEFVENGPTPADPATARLEALQGHFDPYFRSYDLDYPDVERTRRFLEELAGFEAAGVMPRLCVVRLPNDHTSGTRAGRLTPRAYVADNDLALGLLLEGLSRSRFWREMAVFVVEDDAQNGPDHVDAHRTVALVAGPYVKRGAVVSAMYSTSSMLRTMELILGLEPMTQFDAAALPMYACFTAEPDFTPYAHRPATWPLDERNAPTAWGAELSERFDLAREDAADDLELNEVVWRSIRGPDSPMPAPRRAAFVRVHAD
jgi:DNA-binding beta-propeller fold protein YncE